MTDLASFRAYGALFADDREGGLNAIRAEARRMQERVTFEKEIRLAMQQKATEERGHDDPEEDVEDPDEWWRLLQDGGEQERYVPESILSQNYTPPQATRLMHAFMPTTGKPEELGHLLVCKAEPNSPPTLQGGMSPLYKVNVFALEADVEAMRRALFMYGATESLEEKQRMAERPTTSDATRKLHAFHPIAESVATLKSLLEEKADPNGMKPLPPGHIIPLQNVSLDLSTRYVQ